MMRLAEWGGVLLGLFLAGWALSYFVTLLLASLVVAGVFVLLVGVFIQLVGKPHSPVPHAEWMNYWIRRG